MVRLTVDANIGYADLHVAEAEGISPSTASTARCCSSMSASSARRPARETGAFCKLSGLIERALFEWRPADVEPYVLHFLDCFGPERLMFASNWPVSNLHGTYARWWEALQEILDRQGLGVDERRHLFETTAVRAYRLPPARPA